MAYQKPFYRWVILGSNCLLFMLMAMSLTSWTVAAGPLSEAFNLAGYQIMYGASVFVLGYAVSNGVYGKLIGKIGHRITGSLALIVSVLAQIAIPWCGNWSLILILRFAMGFGLISAPLFYVNGLWFDEDELGLANGILSSSLSVGFALGGLLMDVLEPLMGWQKTYLLLSTQTLFAGAQWVILTKKPDMWLAHNCAEIKAKDDVATSSGVAVNLGNKSIWCHPAMWFLGILMFSEFFGVYTLQSMASVYFDNIGYDITHVGILVSIIGFSGIVAGPLGGLVSDIVVKKNHGRKPAYTSRAITMLFGGFLVTAAGCFLVPVISNKGIFVAAFCMLIAGWGMPWMDGVAVATSIDIFGAEKGDQTVGNMTLLGGIGGVISPILTTWIGENIGWTVSWSVVCGVSILGLLGCILIARIKPGINKN